MRASTLFVSAFAAIAAAAPVALPEEEQFRPIPLIGLGGLGGVLGNAVGGLLSIPANIAGGVASAGAGLVGNLIGGLADGARDVGGNIIDFWGGVLGGRDDDDYIPRPVVVVPSGASYGPPQGYGPSGPPPPGYGPPPGAYNAPPPNYGRPY